MALVIKQALRSRIWSKSLRSNIAPLLRPLRLKTAVHIRCESLGSSTAVGLKQASGTCRTQRNAFLPTQYPNGARQRPTVIAEPRGYDTRQMTLFFAQAEWRRPPLWSLFSRRGRATLETAASPKTDRTANSCTKVEKRYIDLRHELQPAAYWPRPITFRRGSPRSSGKVSPCGVKEKYEQRRPNDENH
jgi:hypothetical protein